MSILFSPGHRKSAQFYRNRIDYSCRFVDESATRLYWNATAAASERDIYCISLWTKRCNLTLGDLAVLCGQYYDGNNQDYIYFDTSNRLDWIVYTGGGVTGRLITTSVYRDITNWYHVFVVYDSTLGAAGDRMRMWVNGSEITDFDTDTVPGQGANATFTADGNYCVGYRNTANDRYFDGYIAELQAFPGVKMDVSEFGLFKDNVWIPKSYAGEYPSNGFYLDFANASNLGTDRSGNGNNFTSENLGTSDQTTDTPTNNHPTMNPLDALADVTSYTEGNLQVQVPNDAGGSCAYATRPIPRTGKWWFRGDLVSDVSSRAEIGIVADDARRVDNIQSNSGNSCCYYCNGDIYLDGALEEVTGITYSQGDHIEVFVEGTSVKFYKNGVQSGATVTISEDDYFPAAANAGNVNSVTWLLNFGQLGGQPPDNWNKLNTDSLPMPAIKRPEYGFDVLTWTGDATDDRDISGLSFPPDLMFAKTRSAAQNWIIVDRLRGVGKILHCNDTDAEATENNIHQKWYKDGFQVGDQDPGLNDDANNFVGFCWKKDPIYGFDMVSYIGTEVAHAENHNLGDVPELIIVKNRDSILWWYVYHHHVLTKTDPETDYGVLHDDSLWADANTVWNDTAPTSTQFTVGTSTGVNEVDSNHIAYLFRSIEGFSKVFSYEGNANIDGPFVYCGFRPKMIILKNADTDVRDWCIFDSERSLYNVVDERLMINQTDAEATSVCCDFLSNGFKVRETSSNYNEAAKTIIGIAFAEHPGKWSNAR